MSSYLCMYANLDFPDRRMALSTQSMIEILPYDILETIIQKLAEDSEDKRINNAALSVASLTCQAFLHHCRTHLFSSIDTYRYLGKPQGNVPHALVQNPSLAAHCQTLVLHLDPHHETGDMAEALLQLKKIRSFTLCGHPSRGWNTFSPRMQQAFIHLFGLPSLTEVRIVCEGMPGLPAFLLSSCRNLVDLSLINPYTALTSASCPADLGPPPRLLSLHLQGLYPAMTSLLDIRRSETVPIIDISHIRSLSVYFEAEDGHKALERILLLARKLESFHCYVFPPATFRNLARMLDLRSLTTLRSMHLRFLIVDEMQDLFAGLIEELEEMRHHKNTGLQELLLDLTIERDTGCRFIDREWKKLDDIIGNPSAFPSLYSFTFNITVLFFNLYAHAEERVKRFKEMKMTQLTRLSSRENREFHFEFSVESSFET
ncbi:hypothetical protein B0H34DRAFT_474909 [Crassisporium funariophilum]|nr:hypothetical protein B0H34DRAFT_474909 [Crassisporium funariophilum]